MWISVNKDETEEDFYHYFRSMPWFAVPQYEIPNVLAKTADIFNLNSIPHFVLLDASDGSIITINGREQLLADKYGVEFPWRSRSLVNLIPKSLRKKATNSLTDIKATI